MNVSQRRCIRRGQSVDLKSDFEIKRNSFNNTTTLPIMTGSKRFSSIKMKENLVGQGEIILEKKF